MDISILTSRKIMAKQFFATGAPKQYDNAKWYNHSSVEVNNIKEFSGLLGEMETFPHSLIIRGQLLPDVDVAQPVLRRKDAVGEHRAYYGQRPSVDWMMLDFDKIPAPAWLKEDERLEFLISKLPDYLHDVSYHYHYSSSAGMDGWKTLSCHVYMWLENGRSDDEAAAWASNFDVDDATFRTVQVHYTANPIFHQVVDPLQGRRSGLVTKPKVAASIPLTTKKAPIYENNWIQTVGGLERVEQGGVDYHLSTIAGRLHMPIQKSICSWIASTTEGTDRERLKGRLKDRIRQSSRGDTHHYLSDQYLDQSISSAQRKVRPAANGLTFVAETDFEKLQQKLSRRKR